MQIVTATTPNGIRTRTANIPGRCFGALTFGVGSRDETIMNRQITHLVAHLILARAGRELVPTKLSLTENSVTFSASGTASEVLARFSDLGESIVTGEMLKRSEVERELRIMHIEDGALLGTGSSGPLTRRFGARGLGLETFDAPGPVSFGKRAIREWLTDWFDASNSSLALTKPLPAGFDLPLAVKTRRVRPINDATETPTPAVHVASRGVTLALAVPAMIAEAWGEPIRAELQHAVSERAGLAFSTTLSATRIDATSTLVSFDLDVPHSALGAAAHVVVEEVRRIASEGVSSESLALGHQYERLVLGGEPEIVARFLDHLNENELRDWPSVPREDRLAISRKLTAEDTAETMSAAMDTMTLTIGDTDVARKIGRELDVVVDEFEIEQPSTAKAWKKAAQQNRVWEAKKSGDLPGVELLMTATRILMKDAHGYTKVRFADLVLLATGDGSLTSINDERGCGMYFEASDWKKGDELIAALVAAVPPEIVKVLPAR